MPLKACVCAGCDGCGPGGCGLPGPWGKGSRCPRCQRDPNRHSNPHRGTAEYTRDRLEVFEAAGWRCEWCGRALRRAAGEPGLPPELDHRTPRAQGGADDRSNYVAACRPCNRRRGAMKGRNRARYHGTPPSPSG